MAICLKIPSLCLYKFKFSEAYISLNIDLGFIKVLTFLDFADETESSLADLLPPQDGSGTLSIQ